MARDRRDQPLLRSSPDPQERQSRPSRQRRVSAPWDNTFSLNISHQSRARAGQGQSPPAARRAHKQRGRPGRSNTPNWRSAPVAACISGANCEPIQARPIRGANPVPAREERRHLTRSGRFPSSEVCRGTASGCRCWVLLYTSPCLYCREQ